MRTVVDDLGETVSVAQHITRIVSLVPSLTESVAVSNAGALIGATDWCTHPADLDVTRVRGTKNPDIAKIIALRPDLVLANKEENRRTDVEKLRAAGIAVWVTVIEGVDDALQSLRRLFEQVLRWPTPDWLIEAEARFGRPPPLETIRVVIPIWRDPWIVVGSSTFTGDVAGRLGLRNVFAAAPKRYPQVQIQDITAAGPELVLLPDEPYVFTEQDGPEAFPHLRCALVEGRALTWYGPSLATAHATISAQVAVR